MQTVARKRFLPKALILITTITLLCTTFLSPTQAQQTQETFTEFEELILYDGVWNKNGNQTLREGHPQQAQMISAYIDDIDDVVMDGIEENLFPGAVVMVMKDGVIVKHEAYGDALKYDENHAPLPENERIPMEEDTLFDLASLTKIFTSIAIMQLDEEGLLHVDDPVVNYIPAFGIHDKDDITIRHLLTHTSGLPASISLSEYDTTEEMWQAIYEVEKETETGEGYIYSDLSMMLLGKIVEVISGVGLDDYIEEQITEPLGMENTMFNPPEELYEQIAPTEYTGDRGLIWGTVHDPKAYDLGGVAGHAGLFSTAYDMAILSQAMLNGGKYGQERILDSDTVAKMMANQITTQTHLAQSLGWNLDRGWFMDGLSSPVTAGHTGFTGTSFHINPVQDTIVILYTNRVHPSSAWGSINEVRQQVSQKATQAIPVRGATGNEAWYSGNGPNQNHTLQLPVEIDEEATLSFRTLFGIANDIERDFGYVEISDDGGENWTLLEGTLSYQNRQMDNNGVLTGSTNWNWVQAEYDLGDYEDDVLLRFRYDTNESVNGRGWYIDKVSVKDQNGYVFKETGNVSETWEVHGWERRSN